MSRKILLTLAFAFTFASACSSHQSSFDGSSGPDASAGGDDAGQNDDSSLIGNPGDDGSSNCAYHCSADLHQVLDCNNTVVTTCPPDQGCGGTGCVAACDAANANKSTIGCDYYSVDPGTDG